MEFRVLGPLEVEDRGRVLPLGGPTECHLLALLVCLANEAVPVERLIDELWGEDPPATARNMVQRYVSRLRRSLRDTDGKRLTTEAGGYRLRIGDEEFDWCRFESTVARAHRSENAEAAAVFLREALDMWRGAALAGAGDGPTVAAERVRLEEARLTALEQRIDRDLDVGRHHDLVPELQSLTDRFPLRERFRAQLMLALHRCDRQAEALRSYANYREHLGGETGLEPSPALTQLEDQILIRSPALDSTPPESTAPRTNLPHRLTTFIGRRREVEAVAQMVTAHRLVTVTGVGGIGKTSLAIRAAEELLDAFPEGVWLIELAPLAEPSLVGSAAAEVLGVGVAPGEDTVDALTRHLASRTTLIVLDNCEHLGDGVAGFTETVLRAAPNVRVLATSREPLSVHGEAIMRVPPLGVPDVALLDPVAISNSEAVALFADRARLLRREFRIDATNATAVAEICCRLDGIPLAVELAAARLGTMAMHQIAANIEDRYHLLTRGARTAPRRHQTLRALIDWSYDLLTDDEQVLFRRLAVFAGSFTADSAEQACGFDPLTPAMVLDMLEQLVDASLVIPPQPPAFRFRMLQTIREYVRRLLDACGETDDTMRRLADYLIEAGPASEDGYPGSGDYAAWHRWRDDEQDNFRAVLGWATEVGNSDVAADAAIEFRSYLVDQQLNDEAITWTDTALAMLGDEASHRRLLLLSLNIATRAPFVGERAATLERVQSLAREARAFGDYGMVGFARMVEAFLTFELGDIAAALALSAEAIEGFREAADPRVFDALTFQTMYLTRLGRYEEARAVADLIVEEAARLGERGDRRYAAYSRNVVRAFVAVHAGDLDEAEHLLDAENEYAHQFGPGELYGFLAARSLLAIARGDPAAAAAAATELSDGLLITTAPFIQLDAALLRAWAAFDRVGAEAALPDVREAFAYARQVDAIIDTADVVNLVADAALATGDHYQAVLLHAASSAVSKRSGVVLAEWQRRRLNRSLEALRGALGDARFETLWAEGSAFPPNKMVEQTAHYLDTDRAPSA